VKSCAVLQHGKWSPVREHQHQQQPAAAAAAAAECMQPLQLASVENNEVLRLLPNHRLPVHRHLEQQLDRELERAQSRDKERAEVSDPQPTCTPSLPPAERNCQQLVSVSVDGTASSEGN